MVMFVLSVTVYELFRVEMCIILTSRMGQGQMLTIWLQSFFLLPSNWYEDNCLQTLTWHGLSFLMFTVWHGLFSLVLMFPGVRIEPLLHLQYRVSVYTLFLKRRTR